VRHYFTGGTDNPFVGLYINHAAMAVAVLGAGWSWAIVAVSALAFASLFLWRRPLYPHPPETVVDLGKWCALALVMVLIVYFVGRVVGALRRREQELTEARERAGRHEHLAALTTLAAGAAHELGTPLSTIALAAKEMEHSVDPGSPLAEDARLIRQEVDRCRAILDRMRVDVIEDASQRPSFETLAELIEELQNDLHAEEKARLQVKTEEPGDEVVSRSRVLRMAIGVLLRNAFDASSPDAPVQLLFERANGSMIFQVLDDGQGMSEDVLRRAGEPFFTTKPPGGGMGLGLFLVRLVAETYGGRFELKSTPGRGTRSVLEVPDPGASGKSDDVAEAEDVGGG
jgi:two-component system sensor histidine kinase RegB